jgi:hypothetical protein
VPANRKRPTHKLHHRLYIPHQPFSPSHLSSSLFLALAGIKRLQIFVLEGIRGGIRRGAAHVPHLDPHLFPGRKICFQSTGRRNVVGRIRHIIAPVEVSLVETGFTGLELDELEAVAAIVVTLRV